MPPIRSLFLTARDDRDRLPVILLSGFLGSGKTTLVNALLRDPAMARTAVAVNEFGAIPLDADLIDHGADKTVVLANGCLCCNLAGDLEEAVMRLFTRIEDGALPTFERLIIEPSGLADPAPIAQAILRNPMMARSLRLEGIVTTVDALFARQQIDRFAETRKQIALADMIVITKADLVDTDGLARVEERVRQLNPVASIVRADHGAIAAEAIFPASFLDRAAPHAAFSATRSGFFADGIVGNAGHVQDIVAVALQCREPLDWRAFEAWLRTVRLGHADKLLRVKGMVHIDGVVGPVVVHGVHHVLHPPIALDLWPEAGPATRLILIVDKVIAADIRASWDRALQGMIVASVDG